jgi:hypothetical protein
MFRIEFLNYSVGARLRRVQSSRLKPALTTAIEIAVRIKRNIYLETAINGIGDSKKEAKMEKVARFFKNQRSTIFDT